ncbi:hypothetical protein [Crateriforma conspicua]|uniref:Uncharacterized protein n=1 Tax=Crateriforma conspicua TaxID=2527996 RepID=A0A5C5XRC4_9PLAN|nr:hypothetical protein [Crateriforma conspicua]QDV60941.1 hypothetical protein Mal65_00620 [Crateriforma conspicua]TWT65776.1 hypothetical protein Pan14r_53260 [Crateriforma conspicua]
MNILLKTISAVALGLVVIPCMLHFAGIIGLSTVKWTALVGTVAWFLVTPTWMSRRLQVDSAEVEI